MNSLNISFCVCKIGVSVKEKNPSTFMYKRQIFQKLFPYEHDTLVHDVSLQNDFELRIITEHYDDNEYLALFFIRTMGLLTKKLESRLRILKTVFRLPENSEQSESIESILKVSENFKFVKITEITLKLYELLREEHLKYSLDPGIPEDVQHNQLKPTLRSYQRNAVRWMLHREKAIEKFKPCGHEIRSINIPENKFFLDNVTLKIYDEQFTFTMPSGGILADEMGLGKTVEILSLIMLNMRKPIKVEEHPEKCDMQSEAKRLKIKPRIYCLCVGGKNEDTIVCSMCLTAQHIKCVRKFAKPEHPVEDYKCPACWQKSPIIESGATIIVSPRTIRMQWFEEVNKHISEGLTALIYDGVSAQGWISPQEMSEYDLVLTDYNVLRQELHLFNAQGYLNRLRACTGRYMRMPSPIARIQWWRVVLDEAQMVSASFTSAAVMVKALPATHRWAVTGTPIQKSLEELGGILEFLNVFPLADQFEFAMLVESYNAGNTKPLVNVLGRLMWRSCKVGVIAELTIPPQNEQIHNVIMSNLERLFYRTNYLTTYRAFKERIQRLPNIQISMAELDTRTLNSILEPLRQLRQDCTVPATEKSDRTKKILKPEELVDHLKSVNQTQCKSQLRTIVSSLNGLAGIHMLQKKYDKAINLYQKVQEMANEYTENISVDTLLSIHAVHNLMSAYELQDPVSGRESEIYKKCNEKFDQLERKYLKTVFNGFKKAELAFEAASQEVNNVNEEISVRDKRLSWRKVLEELKSMGCEQLIINKLLFERTQQELSAFQHFQTFFGVDMFLTIWFDKICNLRLGVLNRFDSFKEFTNNVLSRENQKSLEEFVKNIHICHLPQSGPANKEKDKKKTETLCTLCLAMKALTQYECVIFNKLIDEEYENVEGNWSPTSQEKIIKTLYFCAKNKPNMQNMIKDLTVFLKLINCLKKEYKELSKLWIETEFLVKAYDELDMCKMRIEAVPPELLTDDAKTAYRISTNDISDHFHALEFQLSTAEREFSRKLARLKYIEHLCKSEKNEVPECPVCTEVPNDMYMVLECGHSLCVLCYDGIKAFQRLYLTCSICRNRQSYENIYCVKLKRNNTEQCEIEGEYSSKIMKIIQTVLFLLKEDPKVKILIFSNWTTALSVIAEAFKDNKIVYRFEPTVKAIHAFKDTKQHITCLLLKMSSGSKGLNLIEASHVFLVEPILNPSDEAQAISRVHRLGQTKTTTVHRFIVSETIEETIYNAVANDSSKWENDEIKLENIVELFSNEFN